MACCDTPIPIAVTYHKDRALTNVTEILCYNCKRMSSVQEARELNDALRRMEKAAEGAI